ncbi:transposase [Bullifex sp.]|uniref:transposase n=1 Tax=Bullifex sp. TaxID=2815808 RepID=UPI0039C1ADF5
MKTNLVHYRICVCNINYHIVWSVKYRRKVLTQEIESYLNDLARMIAEEKGFTIKPL